MSTSDTTTTINTASAAGTSITSITSTIDSHLEAYALADPARRAALVAANWNADGQLFDPPFEGCGHAEICGLTDVVLAHYAGHSFRRSTDVDAHHRFARYGWELVAPDGTVAVGGTDFVEVDDSGKLLRVVGFFG